MYVKKQSNIEAVLRVGKNLLVFILYLISLYMRAYNVIIYNYIGIIHMPICVYKIELNFIKFACFTKKNKYKIFCSSVFHPTAFTAL